MIMKPHLEYQLSEHVDGFELTITVTTGTNYWTSRPARLEAETWPEAQAETIGQIAALRTALGLND